MLSRPLSYPYSSSSVYSRQNSLYLTQIASRHYYSTRRATTGTTSFPFSSPSSSSSRYSIPTRSTIQPIPLSSIRSFHSSPISPFPPQQSSSSSSSAPSTVASTSTKLATPKKPLSTRIWAKIKEEASHYWHGTRLLGKEIRISARLQLRLLKGLRLTRRERRQLKRTTQDLIRLIPFSVFVIVPFMEFLLPVALKLFPNMLPSTFEDKFKEEEKRRKLLKVRLEMAKFLKETIRESGLTSPSKIKASEEFKEFFRKVRATGESPSIDDVAKVARLFEDDLTLDNLSRPQLVSMCRYMNINAFGTDNFLRYTIRNRLAELERDDQLIDHEGVHTLNPAELVQACQSRGIRTYLSSSSSNPSAKLHSPSEADLTQLRSELEQWIDLHVHKGLSGTLLILSKAFAFNRYEMGLLENGSKGVGGDGKETKEDEQKHIMGLKDTLASLPDTLLNEAELSVVDTGSYKKRLEVLEQQEELIEDEAEQEQREQEARQAAKEKEEEEERIKKEEEKAKKEGEKARKEEEEGKKGEEAAGAEQETKAKPFEGQVPVEEQAGPAAAADAEDKAKAKAAMDATSSTTEAKPEEGKKQTEELTEEERVEEEEDDVRMTQEQVGELGEALNVLSAKSSVLKERAELAELIDDLKETDQDEEQREPADAALLKRVKSMITKIDKQLEEYDQDVGSRMQIVQVRPDGKISVQDLRRAFESIRHRPSDEAISVLISKLDADKDDFCPLTDITELMQHPEEGLGVVLPTDGSSKADDDRVKGVVGTADELRKNKREGEEEDGKDVGVGVGVGEKKKEEVKKPKKEDIIEK